MSGKIKPFIWLKRLLGTEETPKINQETPSPVINDEIRKDLFEKTVKMVEQINYEELAPLSLFMKTVNSISLK